MQPYTPQRPASNPPQGTSTPTPFNRPQSAYSSPYPTNPYYSPAASPAGSSSTNTHANPPQDISGPPVTRSRTLYYLSIRDTSVSSSSSSRARKYRNRSAYADDAAGGLGGAGLDDEEERQGLMGRRGEVAVDMPSGSGLPPRWVDITEEVEDILSRAKLKIASLEKLHAKHVLPGFTDRSAEEREIEAQTVDITRDLRRAQGLISNVRPASNTPNEITAAKNVQRALAGKVQDLSGSFRKKQKVYMQKLQGLAVKNKDLLAASGAITLRGAESLDELEDDVKDSNNQLQSQAMSSTTTNMATIRQRDREVTQIAQSITELADLFRDLGNLVVEQGTLMDCVEYNVMETGKQLEEAVTELRVAQSYQRNTGRRKCILLLILIIFGLILVLIYKPRSHNPPDRVISPIDDYASASASSTTTTTAAPGHTPLRPPRPRPRPSSTSRRPHRPIHTATDT